MCSWPMMCFWHHAVDVLLAADERELARVLGADTLTRLQCKVEAVVREALNEPLQTPRKKRRKKRLRNRLRSEAGASPSTNGERRTSFNVILHNPVMHNVMSLLLHPRILVQTGAVCRAFGAATECAELECVEVSVKQLEQCVPFSGPDQSPVAKLYSLLSQPLCRKLKTLSLILSSQLSLAFKNARIRGSERCLGTVSCFKVLSSHPQRCFFVNVRNPLLSSMASLRAVHLQNLGGISSNFMKHLSKACPSLIELWLMGCTYGNNSGHHRPSWPLTELSGLNLRSLCLDNMYIYQWRRGQPASGIPGDDIGLAFTAVSATIEFISVRGLFRGKMAAECVTTVVEEAQHLKCLRCALSADLQQICKSLRPSLAIHEDDHDWSSLV